MRTADGRGFILKAVSLAWLVTACTASGGQWAALALAAAGLVFVVVATRQPGRG